MAWDAWNHSRARRIWFRGFLPPGADARRASLSLAVSPVASNQRPARSRTRTQSASEPRPGNRISHLGFTGPLLWNFSGSVGQLHDARTCRLEGGRDDGADCRGRSVGRRNPFPWIVPRRFASEQQASDRGLVELWDFLDRALSQGT